MSPDFEPITQKRTKVLAGDLAGIQFVVQYFKQVHGSARNQRAISIFTAYGCGNQRNSCSFSTVGTDCDAPPPGRPRFVKRGQ